MSFARKSRFKRIYFTDLLIQLQKIAVSALPHQLYMVSYNSNIVFLRYILKYHIDWVQELPGLNVVIRYNFGLKYFILIDKFLIKPVLLYHVVEGLGS